MLGWAIFSHSIGMVFRNFGQVFRITLGPALVAGIAMGSTYSLSTKIMSQPGATSSGQAFLLGFLFLVIMWICLLWVTVAWHRFVLLEEYPLGLLPKFQLDRITAYFGTLFAIGLVTGLPVIAVVFLLGQLSGPGPSGEAMIFGLMAIAMFCGLRLSLTLPAAAIGKPLSIRTPASSWA